MLVILISSCSKDPIENDDRNLPSRLVQCNQSELSDALNLTNLEEVEFVNLHIDFLNETSHAITVLNIIFENFDKSLSIFKGQEKEQINTFFTLSEIGNDAFGNQDITTASSDYRNSIEIEAAIRSSSVYNGSSELAQKLSETRANSDSLMNIAIEIQDYFDNENLELPSRQTAIGILLDNAVTLVDCIAKNHQAIENSINKSNYFQNENSRLEFHFSKWNTIIKQISNSIIVEDFEATNLFVIELESALDLFPINDYNLDPIQISLLNKAIDQILDLKNAVKNNELDPEEEDCYPDGFIRYKRLILRYVNHISPGYVDKLNRVLESQYDLRIKYAAFPQYFERLTS